MTSSSRITALVLALLASVLTGVTGMSFASVSKSAELTPEKRHIFVSQLVTEFIEKSHYRKSPVNDALSSQVFDNYLDALDGNKSYFTAADVQRFEKFRYRLDNAVHATDSLDGVFEIFTTYRDRAISQLSYAREMLETEPDFALDEEFNFDREEAAWFADEDALNEFWRKRVKNDALSLVLADKTWDEAAEVLDKRYKRGIKRFDQLTSDEVFETFMNAYAHTLDPHSSYFSPRNSEEYRIQMSLSYFGIGASLQTDDDYVKVLNIIAGGPAAIDESLQPDDRITAVGQGETGELVDVVGWRLDDVVDLIRGPAGTVVRLQILKDTDLPGGAERILALTRDKVKLEEQAAKSEVLTIPRDGRDWKVGVITVPSFYRDFEAQQAGDRNFRSTTRDVKRLIAELEETGIDGLVVDLRNNGGGHLSEATDLSGLFINNGPVVQLRNTYGKVDVLRDPNPNQVYYAGPLTVLVNRFSASASEIFAAAIQDYERGVVIGQQTFGKGSVQNLYALDQYRKPPPGESFGQLTLTIGKYYRVTGESTQHRGVTPDIELPSIIDAEQVGESTRESALPWDRIEGTRYRAQTPLDGLIGKLSANFQQRRDIDPDLGFLIEDIEAAASNRSRTSVSLNLEERKLERERLLDERLARENKRRSAINLEPIESLDELEDEDAPDILLEEAATIVTDMAVLREIPVAEPRTAQIQR